MKKSGIKSFIFSFILTLSAVILVDKMLPSAPKEVIPAKKISYKNIALFSEKKDEIVVASASISSPKIPEIENNIPEIEERIDTTPEPEEEKISQTQNADSVENEIMPDNSDVVYNPDKQRENFAEEYSFEELMAMNNVSTEDEENSEFSDKKQDVFVAQEENAGEPIDEIIVADNSFDENLNLWLPIEKGETKINLKNSSEFSQVAMSDNSVMLSSVIDEEKAKVQTVDDAAQIAKSAGAETSSPWIVAKGAKHAKNKRSVVLADNNDQTADASSENQTAKKPFALNKIVDGQESKMVSGVLSKYPNKKPDGSVDVAYKVMDNLLIPIPEDILQDDNLTPQLSSSGNQDESDEKKVEKKKKEKKDNKAEKTKKKRSTLFESIGSFFSSSKNKKKSSEKLKEYDMYDDEEDEEDDEEGEQSEAASESSVEEYDTSAETKEKDYPDLYEFSEILPREIKLSFQPEKAEISGPTLRWLRAFSDNAKKNPDTYIEVRIDGSGEYALQQRRLNLLQGVFFENGLNPEKINTIFTSREPNSFVIRNIKIIDDKQQEEKSKKDIKPYYQMW